MSCASHVEVFSYSPWPPLEEGESEVEFYLVYQGTLPAAGRGGKSGRLREKHDIRKHFHKQLVTLWNTQPFLANFGKSALFEVAGKWESAESRESALKNFSSRYAKCGYRFMPLVSQWFMAACSLEILFLRRDGPGSLIKSGGDIDNRLKVLFDALRMPEYDHDVCGDKPSSDEEPLFCLLEDDRLISKVSVETNWLLTPLQDDEHINDVHLTIKVKTISMGSRSYETAFHGA